MANWDLVLLGVGFRQASVELRETLAFTADRAAAMLGEVPRIDGLLEAAIVSTCNRTEFYLVTRAGTGAAEDWLEAVRRRQPRAAAMLSSTTLIERRNEHAARHLFRVACGLESSLLGDVHIPAQLRQAYALAAEHQAAGAVLARTFPQAFRVSRRARRDTDIGRGTASLGAAVAALVFERCGVDRPRVVVIGAGFAARDIARCLARRRRCGLVFVNRTPGRAIELARTHGADWAPWARLADEVAQADVVVAAVSSDAPVLTALHFARRRSTTPLLVIDVGVPRNVEPGGNLTYASIDDVAMRRDEALAAREAAVGEVVAMVDEEVERWEAWRRTAAAAASTRRGCARLAAALRSERPADVSCVGPRACGTDRNLQGVPLAGRTLPIALEPAFATVLS
jgi:glutamyl-tRNA reductase